MRANFVEFRRNLPKLCDISKEANFRRYFDAPIVPISSKFRAGVRSFAWHFVPRTAKFRTKFRLRKRNFVWESEISSTISSERAKFRAPFRVGERNFVETVCAYVSFG